MARASSWLVLLLACFLSSGCAYAPLPLPPTSGDAARSLNYGYTPLDPLPVSVDPAVVKPLAQLGDTTSRLAIADLKGELSISYGPVKTGVAGRSYRVVVDYIQYTTKSIPFKKKTETGGEGVTRVVGERIADAQKAEADFLIPVYVGVGVRMCADLSVLKGEVDLTNLIAIGAAAKAERISGTMVIQTLGLSGESVAAAQTIPSSIDETTISNALVTLGTIKSKIYDSGMVVHPRAVAIYNPFPGAGAEFLNGIISNILADPGSLALKP